MSSSAICRVGDETLAASGDTHTAQLMQRLRALMLFQQTRSDAARPPAVRLRFRRKRTVLSHAAQKTTEEIAPRTTTKRIG